TQKITGFAIRFRIWLAHGDIVETDREGDVPLYRERIEIGVNHAAARVRNADLPNALGHKRLDGRDGAGQGDDLLTMVDIIVFDRCQKRAFGQIRWKPFFERSPNVAHMDAAESPIRKIREVDLPACRSL